MAIRYVKCPDCGGIGAVKDSIGNYHSCQTCHGARFLEEDTMDLKEQLIEELDKRHRCVKCKHWSVRTTPSSDIGPFILGSCTKCDKDIITSDPFNGVPCWCPGYEALGKTVPVEEKKYLVKEVTNDDIANMLQRIHHENSFIISAIAKMSGVDTADIDLLINDWDEKFNKAKGE